MTGLDFECVHFERVPTRQKGNPSEALSIDYLRSEFSQNAISNADSS
jgi:hypothetical protein